MGVVDDLDEARKAFERRDWVDAYRALSDLGSDELLADDFTSLATTAYLLGRRNDCVQALQRAYQAHLDAGDEPAAARSALQLALVLVLSGETAVGGGWAARATRILDGLDRDVAARGYARIHDAFRCIFGGDFAGALEIVTEVVEYGERFDDPDLLAHGLNMKGRLMTHAGRVQDGLRLMDESMIGVVAGDVSPIFSGIVYCTTIEACAWVCDYGRMAEWTRALTTWCDAQPGLVAFTGQCAVHRGQLLRLHGAFEDAVDEFRRAADRYALAGGEPAVGLAHEERGDVLRLMGRLDDADQAYEEAVRHGSRAQPGRALLQSARGDVDGAVVMVRSVLEEVRDPIGRNRLLPAAIEVLVAAGELTEAVVLSDELHQIAESFGCTALHAAGAQATGAIALADGEPDAAITAIRSAIEAWTALGARYEIARCRVVLGCALQALGHGTAEAELAAARATFAAIGAAPAESHAARLLGATAAVDRPGGLTAREIEVLRLVAAGKSNADVAHELFVAEKTVARHLSNIFSKLDVASRTAAAAFAYEHDLV